VQASVIVITAFLPLASSTTRVGVTVDQRLARLDVAPEENVGREIVVDGRPQDAVEPRILLRAL
jgi:hypothetical protein